ncbi:MAG: universal stress protein [Pseudonocardia sp.]|nr:universal stress protein [Pseudonocardia sp.]
MTSGVGAPVVVGIDGAGPAVRAVAWAAEEALLRGRPLTIVFALRGEPDAPTRTAAEQALARAATIARAGRPELEVRPQLCSGDPPAALTELARAAELLVVRHRGAGGLDGLGDLVAGSTATTVARTAHSPVIVVRSAPGRPVPDRDRPIVVGVDAAPDSRAAIEFAAGLADRRGSELLAVHVYPEHPADVLRRLACRETEPAREAGARLLAECLAGQAQQHPDLRIRQQVIRGWSPWTLLELSDSAQMVVVGRRCPSGRRRPPLGRCATGLLRAVDCPVAIVPPQAAGNPATPVLPAREAAGFSAAARHGGSTTGHHHRGRRT